MDSFKRAAQVFQSVLDVSEESVQRSWAYYGRGQALLALDRPEEAIFEQAFRENEIIDYPYNSIQGGGCVSGR